MDFIAGFIQTLGLDSSFFIQLAVAGGLYLLVAQILLKPYVRLVEKRESLTEGRFENSRRLEQDIEKLKVQYGEKAKKVHMAFLKDFGKIKEKVELEFKTQQDQLREEQREKLRSERARVARAEKELMALLESDIPRFAETLTGKLKGAS